MLYFIDRGQQRFVNLVSDTGIVNEVIAMTMDNREIVKLNIRQIRATGGERELCEARQSARKAYE